MNVEILNSKRLFAKDPESPLYKATAFRYYLRFFDSIVFAAVVYKEKSSPKIVIDWPKWIHLDQDIEKESRRLLVERFNQDTS